MKRQEFAEVHDIHRCARAASGRGRTARFLLHSIMLVEFRFILLSLWAAYIESYRHTRGLGNNERGLRNNERGRKNERCIRGNRSPNKGYIVNFSCGVIRSFNFLPYLNFCVIFRIHVNDIFGYRKKGEAYRMFSSILVPLQGIRNSQGNNNVMLKSLRRQPQPITRRKKNLLRIVLEAETKGPEEKNLSTMAHITRAWRLGMGATRNLWR